MFQISIANIFVSYFTQETKKVKRIIFQTFLFSRWPFFNDSFTYHCFKKQKNFYNSYKKMLQQIKTKKIEILVASRSIKSVTQNKIFCFCCCLDKKDGSLSSISSKSLILCIILK